MWKIQLQACRFGLLEVDGRKIDINLLQSRSVSRSVLNSGRNGVRSVLVDPVLFGSSPIVKYV